MTEIAHGSIGIDINDADALAGLRRVDAAVQRTMASIEHQKATAKVDANIAPFEDRLNEAKRELRYLQGQRATVSIQADKKQLDKEIAQVRRQIKQLDGEKAVVEVKYKANTAEANAAHKAQMAHLAEQAAAQKAFQRQLNDDHRSALSMDKERTASIRQQTIGVHEQEVQVRKLQKEYAKLTDKLEYLQRQRPLGRETRAKVELDTAGAVAQMALLKAKLAAMGRTPPVDIKVNERGFGETIRRIVDKASNLQDLTIRLGPFTSSIKGAVTALAFLGPTLVDLTGSATALIGVLGTGLAGAASVAGAAAAGAALNFGGVYAAIRPLAAEFKTVNQLSAAYDKAVLKYGESSKQAKKAQEQLNTALKGVDPNVRSAVKGISAIRKQWNGLTEDAARQSFGHIVSQGVKTAQTLLPTFARNTNATLGILDRRFTDTFRRLRGPGAQNAFRDIGANFNTFLGPALKGLEGLGAAFGHVAQSASRLLGPAGRGFERWAEGLDKGTSNASKLDDSMDRLGQHAKDVGKFFMALGRLIVTVLNGGADSGDRMVNTMTNALDRWNEFLKSAEGRQSMAEFFDRAAKGADSLYHAIAPLATAFVDWSSSLSPVITGFLRGIGYVAQLTNGIVKLTGLAGPLGALGATLGAVFAVGKIGAFVSYLSRAADLLRTMGAAQGLKTILGGGLGRAGAAGSFATGGAAAGAEIRSAMIAGGAAAAAEIRGAMVTGGAGGAAGNIAGNVAAGRAAAGRGAAAAGAEAAGGAAAGAKSAGLLRSAFTALKGASIITKASLIGLATWGGYELAKRFVAGQSAADKLKEAFYQNGKAAKDAQGAYKASSEGIADTASAYQRSTIGVRSAKKALDDTKKGTDAHRLALLDYRSALRDNQKARGDWITQSRTMQSSTEVEAQADRKRLDQFKEGNKARVDGLKNLIATSTNTRAVKDAQQQLNAIMAKQAPLQKAAERSANQQAAAALNVGRAWRGQLPVLGAAAQELGKLARQRPNLAQTISVKYSAPKDVGNVARQAQQALKAGGSITQVMKIVADSKDAEDAVRRLRAIALPAKTQRILEAGGKDAISTLQRITGHKLTPKQQRIAQAGGPAVIALLGRILGVKIPPKRVAVNAEVNAALSAINTVRGAIAGISGKTVTITTVHNDVFKGKSVRDSSATGRAAGSATTSLVGEGRTGKGATEIIADHASGLMRVVSKPTILNLKPTEAVIPTEPTYRAKGRELFTDFAKSMGIPAFAKSRKPPKPTTTNKPTHAKGKKKLSLTDFGKKQARETATHNINKHKWKSTLLEGPMSAVETAKTAESDKEFEIARNVGKLQEPASFISVVGQDAQGNDLYEVNGAAVAQWSSALNAIRSQYDELLVLVNETQSAITRAQEAVKTVLATAGKNKSHLLKAMERENGIMTSKKASKSEKQAAKQRYNTYKEQYEAEKKNFEDAGVDKKDLASELHDVRLRRETATDYRDEYAADSAAVAGKAAADAAAAQPDAPRPEDPVAPPTALEAAQSAAGALDAADALAAIGQGTASTDADKIAAQQAIINAAQAQLHDSDPTNDDAANSAIVGAAGAIGSINQASAAAASNVAAQYLANSGARQDLMSNFGSNFQTSGATGVGSGGFGTGAFGMNASAFGAPTGGGAVMMPGAIQQTFYEMPDPHTWSQGISWELQAAI